MAAPFDDGILFGHPIALAYIDPSHREVGTELVVDVRGRDLPVRVVETPFYRRG